MFADKGEAGLVIVGVSGEAVEDVEPFLTKHKVQYPIAVADADDYVVDGIPHAFLIDKDGKIVWRGHPASLEMALVDKTCAGAKPLVSPRGLEAVAALRKKGELGAAWVTAGGLLQAGTLSDLAQQTAREWLAAIERQVADAIAAARAPDAQKDLYDLWLRLEPAGQRGAGIPGADQAKLLFEQLMADPRTKKEVEAGQRVAEAKKLEAAREFDKAYELYKDVSGKLGTTKGGRVATAAYRQLEKDGKLGYVADCAYCKAAGAACPSHKRKKK